MAFMVIWLLYFKKEHEVRVGISQFLKKLNAIKQKDKGNVLPLPFPQTLNLYEKTLKLFLIYYFPTPITLLNIFQPKKPNL
jgi:hypothetical protein